MDSPKSFNEEYEATNVCCLTYKCFYICLDGRKNDIGWQKKNQRLQKLELVFVTNWVPVNCLGKLRAYRSSYLCGNQRTYDEKQRITSSIAPVL